MRHPSADHPSCEYCGLPLPRTFWLRSSTVISHEQARNSERQYCCLGCRLAASITQQTGEAGAIRWTLVKLGFAGFFSMNVMMLTMALWSSHVYELRETTALSQTLTDVFRYLAMVFTAPVLVLLGLPLFENAVDNLQRRTFSTDILLMAGVIASYGYSVCSVLRGAGPVYFEVTCGILLLVTAGRWLEAAGRVHAGAALDALERLLPETVRAIRSGLEVSLPIGELEAGEQVRVLPGERFPSDGLIVAGSTCVDQQIMTGESWPVERNEGSPVFGGTLNLDGAVTVRLTAGPSQGTIQRLIDAVYDARTAKGSFERLAERVSAWFVPLIAALALATFGWHTERGGVDQGILSALSVVLIACPCALGLATPMAVWSALSRAGAARVIINGGEALERLAAINAIRLDKTGTLTTGQPQVLSVEVVDSNSRSAILATAVGLAKSSKHVFSEAIAKIGSHHRVEPLSNVRNIVGKGVTAASTGHCGILYLGSLAFLLDEGLRLTDPLATRYREAVERGAPVVVAGWDGHIQAIFELSEQLRPGVDRFVEACRKMNLDCAVLTGDHANRGQKLSSELDVSVFAELTPDAKVAEIRRAHERFGSVAMVGDGINDAPALAAADVGIAMGCGTEVSRESADACLLQDDLNQIPWLISLSRSTVRTIRMNLFWSFAYNIVGVGLAMTGRLNPIVAAAAMALSSGCVVASSLRLQRLNLGADSARSSSSRAEGAHEPGANSLIEDIADRSCLFAESAT